MIGQFDGGEGREGEEKIIGAGNGHEREDAGLANLEGLSLEELGAMAAREIGEGRQLQAEAVGLSRRSTAAFYRAGRTLWCARKKLKGKGKRAWTKWQKAHGIPVTSAWQAIRLYEEAEGEEAVVGLTRTQALKKYGITKPKKAHTQPAPSEGGKAPEAGVAAPQGNVPPESPDLRLLPEGDDGVGKAAPGHDVSEVEQAEAAQEHQDAPTTLPAAEILLIVARRLEILEQDHGGGDLGDEAIVLIDRAIATLRRLRGDAAFEVMAA